MEHWQYLLAAALLGFALLALRSAVIERKKQKERDFSRKLETVLKPKESIKVVCPRKKGRCILTSRRLLFETASGFTAVPLTSIQRVQCINKDGNTTTSIANTVRLTVKADKDYTIRGSGEEFTKLATQLVKKMEQKEKRKEKKATLSTK